MALFGVGVVLPPSGAVLLPPATGAVGSEAAPWPGAVGAVVGVVLDDAGHGGGGFNEAIVEALNSLAHSV